MRGSFRRGSKEDSSEVAGEDVLRFSSGMFVIVCDCGVLEALKAWDGGHYSCIIFCKRKAVRSPFIHLHSAHPNSFPWKTSGSSRISLALSSS